MLTSDQQDALIGRRAPIVATSNEFDTASIGKSGTIVRPAPLGMLALDLDDGTTDYWAKRHNLRIHDNDSPAGTPGAAG